MLLFLPAVASHNSHNSSYEVMHEVEKYLIDIESGSPQHTALVIEPILSRGAGLSPFLGLHQMRGGEQE